MSVDLAAWLEAEALPPHKAVLPSGRTVQLAHLLRHEERAAEPVPRASSCWAPNKPPIEFGGEVTWAEFVIVRLLEKHGWEGRWIKNWTGGREFCAMVGRPERLPPAAAQMFAAIDKRAASRTGGGAWDVFAWRDDQYLCIESKQHRSSDSLRPGQLAWLEAGLAVGLKIEAFAVVEYSAPKTSS